MKLWIWEKGRQMTCEYEKMCLWSFRIWKWGFDAYILKYQGNTHLPPHRDPVIAGKHWRLNISLWGSSAFFLDGKLIDNRVILFRPDLKLHDLFVYRKTVKLSLGFVRFD